MSHETVAIGADHAGFELKSALASELKALGYDVLDEGTNSADPVDYPDFARTVAEAVASGAARYGLLICGSGIGMSIAANRHAGVRAALCHDEVTARLAREHNDANVLVLGSRLIDRDVAEGCVRVFFSTAFDGGERHARRVAKLG